MLASWWMINDKSENELIKFWLENGLVTIGWKEVGNPLEFDSKDKLLIRCDEVYSNEMPVARIQYESQIWRFSREISSGDRIIAYDKTTSSYHVGIVTDEGYQYKSDLYPEQPNTIKVKWVDKKIHENSMSKELKDSLNQNSVVFRVFNCDSEIERLLISNGNVTESLKREREVYTSVLECTKDLLLSMDKNKFKIIVKDIIAAMGYKLNSNYDNANENSYLAISEDELGFTKTIIRICHMENNTILKAESIINALGGYTDNIKKYLIISRKSISQTVRNEIADKYFVVNLSIDDIIINLFKYYDDLSEESKKLLSLKKVYI